MWGKSVEFPYFVIKEGTLLENKRWRKETEIVFELVLRIVALFRFLSLRNIF